MFPQNRYIIFKYPEYEDDIDFCICNSRRARFRTGGYNKKLVSSICKYNGLKYTDSEDYTLLWGTSPEIDSTKTKCKVQKLNHFPQSKQLIGNKAEFAKIIQTHPLYQKLSHFFPRSYVLPQDHSALYHKMKTHSTQSFISKPPRGSCGSGIKIVSFKDFYSISPGSVVSEYISRPLLIDGFKFDLRVYVLVTSFCPLRAFVCKEGMARFATEYYSKGSSNPFASLTNASLNKKAKKYCSEFKWKLSELLLELEKRWGRDPAETMNEINLIVSKTLTLIQATMSTGDCDGVLDQHFELYGFDILIDHDFKMWLLEVNTMPALGTTEDCDYDIKAPLICQALSIVGIPDVSYSDLKQYESRYQLPEGGLEEYQSTIIKMEDERNRLSGEGFIRIFPSPMTESLERFHIRPSYLSRIHSVRSDFAHQDEAKFIGGALTGSQGMILLIHILTRIENQLRSTPDPRLVSRLQCFLCAQGYKSTKGTANTRAILRDFIDRVNKWIAISKEEFIIPVESRKKILSASDSVISEILANCDMKLVKNVRLLFP